MRDPEELHLSDEKITDLLDQLCKAGDKYNIYFLWRPFLNDPKDDHVLELAIASRSPYIVTYNKKDFIGLDKFDIKVVTAKEMLGELGELS